MSKMKEVFLREQECNPNKVIAEAIAALIAWLESDCPHSFYLFHGERKSKCIRKYCPQCWQALKESVK
jgi:hypothetical protein